VEGPATSRLAHQVGHLVAMLDSQPAA